MTFKTVAYLPQEPQHYHPNIGLIGCGGISKRHLAAYREAGYRVTVLSDLDLSRAEARRAEFFPDARVVQDYHELLADPDIEVVDISTHPEARLAIIEAALQAGKHVLSQKPFVVDLNDGKRLVDLAAAQGVKLAVNQNGRWAPQFSYLRQAVAAGLVGEIKSMQFGLQFDHNWTSGTPFDSVHHLLLYDYAIHWFDFIQVVMGQTAESVFAEAVRSSSQKAIPPLLAHAVIRYPRSLVSLSINGDSTLGQVDQTRIVGTKASLVSEGPDLNQQQVTVLTPEGSYRPELRGHWMLAGFHGSMAELLLAIEEDREPSHGARQNLESLALCFAAVASADTGQPIRPGEAFKIALGAND